MGGAPGRRPLRCWSSRPVSPGVEELPREGAEDAADDRPDDGDPGVAPVRRTLPRDGEDGVRDPWREVARRVDRVARGAAERETDAEDQEADEQAREAALADAGRAAERQH